MVKESTQRKERRLEVRVEDVQTGERDEQVLFWTRKVPYALVKAQLKSTIDIPTVRLKGGEKRRIGYRWHYSRSSDSVYGGVNVVSYDRETTTKRPIFQLGDGLFRFELNRNDDFQEVIDDVVKIMVENEGYEDCQYQPNEDGWGNRKPKKLKAKISYRDDNIRKRVLEI